MMRVVSRFVEFERTRGWIRGIAEGLGELVAPSRCVECGGFAQEAWTCQDCFARVRLWDESWCHCCATPPDRPHAPYCLTAKKSQGKKRGPSALWRDCRALGAYEGVLRTACIAGKKADGAWLADHLASKWWSKHRQWALSLGPCHLVPIPRHWSRRWLEGHDPAFEYARSLMRCWRAESERDPQAVRIAPILKRSRATPKLSGLDAVERMRVLDELFEVTAVGKRLIRETDHFILVDDICTTGATVVSATKSLAKAGIRHLDVITIARTLEGDG